jgi:hypothetical protein
LRQSLLEKRDRELALERQRKDDLAKARRASTRTPTLRGKTSPGADLRAPKASLKEELEAVWQDLVGA